MYKKSHRTSLNARRVLTVLVIGVSSLSTCHGVFVKYDLVDENPDQLRLKNNSHTYTVTHWTPTIGEQKAGRWLFKDDVRVARVIEAVRKAGSDRYVWWLDFPAHPVVISRPMSSEEVVHLLRGTTVLDMNPGGRDRDEKY